APEILRISGTGCIGSDIFEINVSTNIDNIILTVPVHCEAGLGQKNTPLVSQRGIKDDSILFSVNCYPSFLVTI
ncbi:hypothetical protein, partial [Blautia massiliensis (ex Liu et al. 2021)]|uniref:hypothetical protein n=1 Tax=Blautia massiliensis (ex Liu et al. 2021) TaxID=3062492 RepID=UPI003F8872E5